MPASNAASVHARVCSKPTPPAKVSHEPSEISETSRSDEPSLRYLMTLLSALGGGGGRVLVVGDVVAPVGLGAVVAGGFGDGEMGHVVVGGGAVPVPPIRGRGDDVAGADLLDGAAAGLDQALAFGDVQGLADGVGVPGGVGRGGEPDGADPYPLGFRALGDEVDEDVAGEPLGRALGGRLPGLDGHGRLL